MTIYVPLIGMLWRTLESYGVDPSHLIPRQVYRPGAEPGLGDRISIEVFEELLAQAVELVGDPAIGLRVAEHLHPSHLGALGHAWMASSSLRTAIMRSQRFFRMLNEQLTLQVSEPPNVLQVEYRQPGSTRNRAEQFDSRLGGLLLLCRLNYGDDLLPAYVCMRRAEPANPDPWTRFFGKPVQFGKEFNCLALHEADADKPLTVSSPQLVSVHEDILAHYLARMDRSSIKNRVRAQILDLLPSGRVKEDSIAAQLNMSRRTLHNRLRNDGTSFRKLLTELRKDLVHRYVGDDSYSITEIAFLLGYADTSSFSRAFKAWFGESPTEYRRSLKGLDQLA
jgi:AraC-like DNA-binding protein